MNSYYYNTDIFIIPESEPVGENNRLSQPMVVLVREGDLDANKTLLDNILKAIGFELDRNAAVLSIENGQSINLASHLSQQVAYVLCFGFQPSELGIQAGFRANVFYATESFRILLTHGLDKLDQDKKLKMALWTALQKAFKQ